MEPIRYSIDEDCAWITVLDSLVSTTPPELPVSAATVVELAAVAARAQVEQQLRRGQQPDWSADAAEAVAGHITPIVLAAVCPDEPCDQPVAASVGDLVARTLEKVWAPHVPVGRCRNDGDPLTVVRDCGCRDPYFVAPRCRPNAAHVVAPGDADEQRRAAPADVRCTSDGCEYVTSPQSVDA